MRRLLIIPLIPLCMSLAACDLGTLPNPFQTVKNPVSTTNLYEGEIAFDASLKVFNALKKECANRILPPACRTYVKQGQPIIVQIYAADKAARDFVKKNPTLDATNVVQAFTGLVSNFKDVQVKLSATKTGV